MISTLAEDEADYNYWNQAFWVHFPRSAIDEAEGKTIFKAFSFASEQSGDNAGSWAGKGKIVRLAQCEIPDSDFAETLLIEQFIKFDEKLVDVFNRQLKSKAGDWECIEFYHTYDCEYDPSEGMVICTIVDTHCVTWVYVEEPPISGGGGGFPGNDPGECDPMGTEPCFDGGGGSSIPPPEPDPCDETNPPSWCTDKCETGDATIDNTGVQETFEYLYDKSDFDLPIDQRTEQGGWITKDPLSGDFGFTEFPSNWPRYACGIGMPQNWVNAAPSNTVGMVHTHPFFENDDTTDPNVCGEEYGTEDWTSGFGNDDLQALIDLANHLSDHTIKGYVIDGNNIVTFNTLSFTGPEDIDPRCGY